MWSLQHTIVVPTHHSMATIKEQGQSWVIVTWHMASNAGHMCHLTIKGNIFWPTLWVESNEFYAAQRLHNVLLVSSARIRPHLRVWVITYASYRHRTTSSPQRSSGLFADEETEVPYPSWGWRVGTQNETWTIQSKTNSSHAALPLSTAHLISLHFSIFFVWWWWWYLNLGPLEC